MPERGQDSAAVDTILTMDRSANPVRSLVQWTRRGLSRAPRGVSRRAGELEACG